jgi:hypothetical protein
MKQIIAAVLLGLTVVLSGVPGVVAPVAAQAAHGWHCKGPYCSYGEASEEAAKLRACGYQAYCVRDCRTGYWYVKYR